MALKIFLEKKVRRQLDKLSKELEQRIITTLKELEKGFSAIDIKKLKGTKNHYRIRVGNHGELGLSLRTNEMSVSFMKKGSAVVVGLKDEADAVSLYKSLLGKEITKLNNL